jgi:recombination protein RecA
LAIEDIIAKLDAKTKKRIELAQQITLEKIPLGSIGLTQALNGGIGKGRQTLVYGNKSSGKSSMLLQTIGEAQKRGLTCAWIDAEKSFDTDWASRLGVDNSQLLVSNVMSIDDFTSVGCSLLEAEIDIIVVDSISALLPSTYFEKAQEMKDGLDGTKQIGSKAKELSIAVNKFNFANKSTALILISQIRNQFNTYGASLKPDGGQAMMFYSSTVIKLWSSAAEKEQKTLELSFGDNLISTPIGRPVNFTVEYNKIGPPSRTGTYDFYYHGDFVGVDQIGEIADLAVKHGLFEKGGAWFSYKENKMQGRDKVIKWLKANPLEVEELVVNLLG